MKYDFSNLSIVAVNPEEKKAAEILKEELQIRTGAAPEVTDRATGKAVILRTDTADELPNKDSYKLTMDEDTLEILAKGIRALCSA